MKINLDNTARGEKVLITGVAGFIGSNLADRLLAEGYEVIGVDNLSYGILEQVPKGVRFHKTDIRSKALYPLFKGVDYVFHFAAKNCISDCQSDPLETADINVTGTVNVFEASRRARVKKVIYAESSAIYEGVREFPTSEENEKPEGFYALSKLCDHEFARAYMRFYNLACVGLRYFNVYGPRQDYRRTVPPVMSAFIIKMLKKEQPVIYGDGGQRRDFIHIDDVNDFHLLCIKDNRVDGNIYNLGYGKNYSVLEIYSIIKRLTGSQLEPIFKPSLEGDTKVTLADNAKARSLGWSPAVSLEQGLKSMVSYIQSEIRKGNI